LNRRPLLKSFLKDAGEADSYENLTITFIPGRPAVLTIYNNNNNNDGDAASNEKEVEKVDLFNYKDKDQLHALLQSKGFQRRRSSVVDGVGSSSSSSTTSTATILANGAAGVVVTSREVIQLDPLVPHNEKVDRELFKTSSATRNTCRIVQNVHAIVHAGQLRGQWTFPWTILTI
jgi:Sep15/SelM redox domain